MRLIDSCITELEAQGPSRTYNKIQAEEAEAGSRAWVGDLGLGWFRV